MKRIVLLLIFISLLSYAFPQIPVGKWRTHFSYAQTRQVIDTKNKLFGLSSGCLYYVEKADQSIHLINKDFGLSDSDICLIGYSELLDQLVIIYHNGNIDILTDSGIHNIPELKNKVLPFDKVVNHIYFHNTNTYLSTSFGIVVLNNKKFEIKESYILSENCSSSTILNDTLYVAQNSGILKGAINTNLSDPQSWQQDTSNPFKHLFIFKKNLYAVKPDGTLCIKKNQNWTALSKFPGLKKVRTSNNHIFIIEDTGLHLLNENINTIQYAIQPIHDASSFNGEDIWIAQDKKGLNLLQIDNKNNISYTEELIMPEGPSSNNAFLLKTIGDKIYCLGGGRWSDRYNRPAQISYFKNEKWINPDLDTLTCLNNPVKDFINIAAHPSNQDHYYVSSWGDGLYEFKNDKCVNLFNSELKNTSIETIFPGESHASSYNRIDGPAFDKYGNMYVTNTQVKQGIQVYKNDGKWQSLYYPELKDKETIGPILVSKEGINWVTIPRPLSQQGIFVFDTRNTINDVSDDKTRWFSVFYDQDGKIVSPSVYYCLTEDKEGVIWIGTDLGPLILNNTYRIFESDYHCYRPKIARNDGSGLADYLLNNIAVSSIYIDGANRKWIGSMDNGIYLVNKSGDTVIGHYSIDNSILPSNTILSIAISPESGEVFIGTDKGIVSFRGTATEPRADYEQVHSFPNPVRPGYEGPVTITGLRSNSYVKITDINNNLIYEGDANGGQFVWNQTNIYGKLVSSGIYIAYISNKKTKDGTITKIMIVR